MNELARMRTAGAVVRGELGHENTAASALDLDAKTPKATLSDRMDISRRQTYSTKNHKVPAMPTIQPLRYVATATPECFGGRWMMTTSKPIGEQPCRDAWRLPRWSGMRPRTGRGRRSGRQRLRGCGADGHGLRPGLWDLAAQSPAVTPPPIQKRADGFVRRGAFMPRISPGR